MRNAIHRYLVEYEVDPATEKLWQERWYLIPASGGEPVLHRDNGPAVTTYDVDSRGEPTREYYDHGTRTMVIASGSSEPFPS